MLEELVERLAKCDVAEIAYKTGLSISTVSKILSGTNKNPNLKTVEALQEFLRNKEQE